MPSCRRMLGNGLGPVLSGARWRRFGAPGRLAQVVFVRLVDDAVAVVVAAVAERPVDIEPLAGHQIGRQHQLQLDREVVPTGWVVLDMRSDNSVSRLQQIGQAAGEGSPTDADLTTGSPPDAATGGRRRRQNAGAGGSQLSVVTWSRSSRSQIPAAGRRQVGRRRTLATVGSSSAPVARAATRRPDRRPAAAAPARPG